MASSVFSQNMSRLEYIEKYKEIAISEMNKYKIPASITLAQGILESQNGNSELASKSNNHFGIKCHSNWEGQKVYHDDDKKQECFRKYRNVKESFEDHSVFLLKERYASLFDLSIKDYSSWAKGLKKAGYATDPAYAKLLIKIIEDNGLSKYDKGYEGSSNFDNSIFSGAMYGWENLLSQQIIYINDSKDYYLEGFIVASLSDASVMFGGGYMLTKNIVIGPEFGYGFFMENQEVDYAPKYAIANHFLFSRKQKKWTIKIQLSTYDFNEFKPSFSIGLLK